MALLKVGLEVKLSEKRATSLCRDLLVNTPKKT